MKFLSFRHRNAVLSVVALVLIRPLVRWPVPAGSSLLTAIRQLTRRLFVVDAGVPELAIDVRDVLLHGARGLGAYVPLFRFLL